MTDRNEINEKLNSSSEAINNDKDSARNSLVNDALSALKDRDINKSDRVKEHNPPSAPRSDRDWDDLINKIKKHPDKEDTRDFRDRGDSMIELLEKLKLSERKQGAEKLSTGDYIIRENNKSILFTPNGDRITVNGDGTSSIKGDVKEVSTDKNGVTTVKFQDGSSASFDKQGFTEIKRGGESVKVDNCKKLDIEPYPFLPRPIYKGEYDELQSIPKSQLEISK